MPKKKKARKRKPAVNGPPKEIKDYARAYRCSHCRSLVDGVYRDTLGIYRIFIKHDESCPVLRGTLTDMHDAVRAAVATGQNARIIDDPLGGGAE